LVKNVRKSLENNQEVFNIRLLEHCFKYEEAK
jgi:hypothetical protein